jgi:glucokinase
MSTGRRAAIGIDVGGTALKAGLVDEAGRIAFRAEKPTLSARLATAIETDVRELLRECREAARDAAQPVPIGLALPGILTPDGLTLAQSHNLPALEGYPLVVNLGRAAGCAPLLLPDTDAAALAEHRCGAGHGAERLLVASVGTGIGISFLVEGRLPEDRAPLRGLGHVQIDSAESICTCGRRGCLESLASGAALVRSASEALGVAVGWERLRTLIAQHEPALEGAINEWATALVKGMRVWHSALRPTRIVLAGGVTMFGVPVLDRLQRIWKTHGGDVSIVFSPLGRDASIIGAALAALDAARSS